MLFEMLAKVLTILIIVIGFAVMVMVLRRLTQTAQQIAELRSDMAKSDAKLQIQLEVAQQQHEAQQHEARQALLGQQNEDSSTRSNTSSNLSNDVSTDAQIENQKSLDNTTKEL